MQFKKYQAYLTRIRCFGNHPAIYWEGGYGHKDAQKQYHLILIAQHIFTYRPETNYLLNYGAPRPLAQQFDYCYVYTDDFIEEIEYSL